VGDGGGGEGGGVPEQRGLPYLVVVAGGLGVPPVPGVPSRSGVARLQGRAAAARAVGSGWLRLQEREGSDGPGSHLRSWPRERPRAAGVGVGAYLGGRRSRGAQKCAGSGAQEGRGGRGVGAAVVAAPCSVVAVGF